MGEKRKDRNSSGSGSVNKTKLTKQRGPSQEDTNISISELLGQASAALYPDAIGPLQSEVFERSHTDSFKLSPEKMEDSGQEPTIKDVLNCMRTIDTRLLAIELKLHAIDSLENKVCDFDKELKKIWVALEDRVKRTDARACALEEKVELVDVGATIVADRLTQLEKERNELRDDVAYLKSQSMRNNLVFTNIPEDNSTGSHRAEAPQSP
ncbi:hypothetical protein DPMN_042524 [Dreissena polymorpha]|uniref:Uncharacterized protein n=1 Tax=Dreissena polymorpha TaxID=45954 RepID=A0A9D4D269_DREPO|nr:hypothetical protein DPMN_042524 [Dreissena polymorpha]